MQQCFAQKTPGWLPTVAIGLMACLNLGHVFGQDSSGTAASRSTGAASASLLKVWYEPRPRPSNAGDWTAQSIRTAFGRVLEFNDDRVRLESDEAGNIVSVSMDQLVWMQPRYHWEKAAEGMQLFDKGEYEQAIPLLLGGVTAGPPKYEQYWLTGHLAMAAFEIGNYSATLELVRSLNQSNAPSAIYPLLPVQWHSRPTPPQAVAAAREAIGESLPLVRLVSASWLLSSVGDRLLAERTLDALAGDRRNPSIQRMAEVVRFRRVPVPQIESASRNWIEQVERLPIGMQGGPWLTIADRLEAAGVADRAREYYLTVTLLHRVPKPLHDFAREALRD